MHAASALKAIVEIIAPYIGRTMAQSSIDIHCKNVGITGATINHGQLDELLHRLALGLNIFIGRDKTATVVDQIRHGVEGLQ